MRRGFETRDLKEAKALLAQVPRTLTRRELGCLAMAWSMDRQGIRTLFDRESNRLKQFELSGPRRERVSLDAYPDELAARDAEFRREARYGKWSEPAQHGLRFYNFRVS
jgi:hypothetical protein